MTTTETVTFIGIGLTFIVGVFNLILTFRNVRKTTFINSVTTSRIKFIQDIRNYISEFCGLIYSYNTEFKKFQNGNDENKKKLIDDLIKRVDNLKYLIRLHLNVEDKYFDPIIIKLIDEIIELSDNEPSKKIEELIIIMQFLLKLEWEGAKLESSRGIVSKRRKRLLYKKFEQKHKSYIQSEK